jgi:hypothetical protein
MQSAKILDLGSNAISNQPDSKHLSGFSAFGLVL